MQQPATNAATAKFQLALPSLLTPVSPHLAALHATRARRLLPAHPSLADAHCTRCGAPFLPTGGRTRAVRTQKQKKKKRTPSKDGPAAVLRAVRRSCRVCGFDDDVPLSTAHTPPVFPKTRDRARRKSSATEPRAPGAASHAVSSSATGQQQQRVPESRPPPPSAAPSSSRSSSVALPNRSVPASAPAESPRPDPSKGPAQPKARPKKKTGLQSLLARNREKQEQEQEKKKREGQGQGLSAFLQGSPAGAPTKTHLSAPPLRRRRRAQATATLLSARDASEAGRAQQHREVGQMVAR
ncbi:hypothetical protein C2E23DRAFT_884669 [Lenzites betulinus]|nr:hypothetical protein C2E23DRAFT_884669 [Lenzites betulinus]